MSEKSLVIRENAVVRGNDIDGDVIVKSNDIREGAVEENNDILEDAVARGNDINTTDDQNLLYNKYFNSRYMFQFMLDSYNDFLDVIKTCMDNRPFERPNQNTVRLEFVRFLKPGEDITGTSFPRTHNVCKIEGSTYSLGIVAKIVITNKKGKVVKESREEVFTNIPLMVYSKQCVSRNVLKHDKNPSDPGCYFVIGGQVHKVLLFESGKGRNHQYNVLIGKDDPDMLPYITYIGETSVGSSFNRICMERKSEKAWEFIIKLSISKSQYSITEKRKDKEEKEEKKTKKQLDTVNILAVNHFFDTKFGDNGKRPEKKSKQATMESFTRKLRDVIPKDQWFRCRSIFISTETEYELMSESEIVEKISTKMSVSNSEELDKEAAYAQHWKDKLFPMWIRKEEKLSILATLTARLLQCRAGYISPTDKGHWGHVALIPPGGLLYDNFRRKFGSMVSVLLGKASFVDSWNNPDKLMTEIKNYNFESQFIKDFKPAPGKKKESKGKESTGKGSKKPQKAQHKAISVISAAYNTLGSFMELGKTNNKVDKHSPNFEVRAVKGSSLLFTCSWYTTDNDKCGIPKQVAIATYVSIDENPYVTIKILNSPFMRQKGIIVQKKSGTYEFGTTKIEKIHNIPVYVNGLLIGFTYQGGYTDIRQLKRMGIISRYSAVVFTTSGVIEIYVDSYRLLVPLLSVSPVTGLARIYDTGDAWKSMSFNTLVSKGYIDYLDNYEIENKEILVAESTNQPMIAESEVQLLTHEYNEMLKKEYKTIQDRILIKNLENEIRILSRKYTHIMLHPAFAYSYGTASVPMGNTMQTCRLSFGTKMKLHAIHNVGGDPNSFETGYTAFGKRSIVNTNVLQMSGYGELTPGETTIVAVIAQNRNQEDALRVSRSYIQKGGFRYMYRQVYTTSLESDEEHFGNMGVLKKYTSANIRHIQDNGLPSMGAILKEGDVIIYKYKRSKDGDSIQDLSEVAGKGEGGTVVEVVTFMSSKNKSTSRQLTARVLLVQTRAATEGAKLATAHAQKHIINLTNAIDLPYDPETGLTPDIIIGPMSVPTRMTTGTLIGPLIGGVAAVTGESQNTSAHSTRDMESLKHDLIEAGYSPFGLVKLVSGITGEDLWASIYIGHERMYMLPKIAIDNFQCRGGIGKINPATGQAEANKTGKLENKGQKFGEQDIEQALKYGAPFLIYGQMNYSCDATSIVVCLTCGDKFANYNSALQAFSCDYCKTTADASTCRKLFGRTYLPRSTGYLMSGLSTMGIYFNIKYVRSEEFKSHIEEKRFDYDDNFVEFGDDADLA